MSGAKRVRLIDVARHAGVSMKTVSNVVHDYQHVTPKMRIKVQESINVLGYRPNLTARQLVTGKTGMLALAIPETNHPYFSTLADRIVTIAEERGYRVLIEQTDGKSEREMAVLRDREAGLVDGVIFQPATVTSLEIADVQEGTPVVLLGEAAMPHSFDHVMIDNTEAARMAVASLLGAGRKRIAFLGVVDGDNAGATVRRLAGYQAALEQAGMFSEPELILEVADFFPESARAALTKTLEAGVKFDALLCRDDRFAVAALQALRVEGISVPDQVSVIGWDDTELARYAHPTVTSISPDKEAIARMAVDMLIERIEGHQGVGRHKLAPFQILNRESAPLTK